MLFKLASRQGEEQAGTQQAGRGVGRGTRAGQACKCTASSAAEQAQGGTLRLRLRLTDLLDTQQRERCTRLEGCFPWRRSQTASCRGKRGEKASLAVACHLHESCGHTRRSTFRKKEHLSGLQVLQMGPGEVGGQATKEAWITAQIQPGQLVQRARFDPRRRESRASQRVVGHRQYGQLQQRQQQQRAHRRSLG